MTDIVNRHIRREWKTWLDRPSNVKNPVALCGKRTIDKYLGVPGITEQNPTVSTKAGEASNGWCIYCAVKALNDCVRVIGSSYPKQLIHLYQVAQNELLGSMNIDLSENN